MEMEEQLFKVGDRLYDYNFGWGNVTNIYGSNLPQYSYSFKMVFDRKDRWGNPIEMLYLGNGFAFAGDAVSRTSFTEYNFVTGGFSQVRPK